MSRNLEKVSREIRQNVPHLKRVDDFIKKMRQDMLEQEKRIWEVPIRSGKIEKKMGGIYPLMKSAKKESNEYLFQAYAYKKLMEGRL